MVIKIQSLENYMQPDKEIAYFPTHKNTWTWNCQGLELKKGHAKQASSFFDIDTAFVVVGLLWNGEKGNCFPLDMLMYECSLGKNSSRFLNKPISVGPQNGGRIIQVFLWGILCPYAKLNKLQTWWEKQVVNWQPDLQPQTEKLLLMSDFSAKMKPREYFSIIELLDFNFDLKTMKQSGQSWILNNDTYNIEITVG